MSRALEAWIIATLARFNVTGERREERVGVWVRRPEKPPLPDGRPAEDKIAAIGIRVRRWVSFHGISLNVDPDARALFRHRPLRRRRLRRHQPGRPRHSGLDAGGRRGAESRVRADLRNDCASRARLFRGADDGQRKSRRFVLAATVLASSMAFIDGTVVTIALPVIQRQFGASFADCNGW